MSGENRKGKHGLLVGLSQEAPEERLVDQLGSSTRSRLPGSVGRFGWFASSLLAVMTEHKINCAAGRHSFFFWGFSRTSEFFVS